ncbi:tryptophan--tRNA ligase, partial [bacterium]|nr:tryptophan--tRNA ligase [bacterium]
MREIIMSAMRPTGKLHLGHYLGVIQNWVKLQDKYECYFGVADWHALTTKYDNTENLRQDCREVIMDWLASGIDPDKSVLYIQSLIPEIAELNIYLGMITPESWVEKDPTLKDMVKILREKESNAQQLNYGLLGYPVLMSADIMIFNADAIPVGIDQVAHIEITRDIAKRFNNLYKTDFFKEAKPLLNNCSLICGLDGNKMGKSFNNDIKISDTEEI